MTPQKDAGATHRLPKTGEEQMSTYVKAATFLLKSYATGFDLVKATSATACLKKASMETSVQFVDALRSRFIQCGNAYPEVLTKEVFVDSLRASIQSTVKMFWRRKQVAHLLETAQYKNTLL